MHLKDKLFKYKARYLNQLNTNGIKKHDKCKSTGHLNNTCEEYSLHKMKYLTLVFQAHLDLLCPALREIFLPLLLLTVLTQLLPYPNIDNIKK